MDGTCWGGFYWKASWIKLGAPAAGDLGRAGPGGTPSSQLCPDGTWTHIPPPSPPPQGSAPSPPAANAPTTSWLPHGTASHICPTQTHRDHGWKEWRCIFTGNSEDVTFFPPSFPNETGPLKSGFFSRNEVLEAFLLDQSKCSVSTKPKYVIAIWTFSNRSRKNT